MQDGKGLEHMQITDVRVRKVAKEGKLKAVVSITMDDEFVVHDIKVIEGEKGLFIAMPNLWRRWCRFIPETGCFLKYGDEGLCWTLVFSREKEKE